MWKRIATPSQSSRADGNRGGEGSRPREGGGAGTADLDFETVASTKKASPSGDGKGLSPNGDCPRKGCRAATVEWDCPRRGTVPEKAVGPPPSSGTVPEWGAVPEKAVAPPPPSGTSMKERATSSSRAPQRRAAPRRQGAPRRRRRSRHPSGRARAGQVVVRRPGAHPVRRPAARRRPCPMPSSPGRGNGSLRREGRSSRG